MASTSVVAVVKVPPIIIVLCREMNFESNLSYNFRRTKCLETLKTTYLDNYTNLNKKNNKVSRKCKNIVLSCDMI